MREIKFRAWDKESNVMIYSDRVYPRSSYKFEFDIINNMNFTLTKMIDRVNVHYEDGEETYIEIFNKVDAELMQYTGLKDKNGKDVYEGYILEDKYGYRYTVRFGTINISNQVCIKKQCTCFYKQYLNESFGLEPLNNTENDETIGNVYENPELLK